MPAPWKYPEELKERDAAGGGRSRSSGQHRPGRRDPLVLLHKRADRTRRLRAHPAPLTPHNRDRAAHRRPGGCLPAPSRTGAGSDTFWAPLRTHQDLRHCAAAKINALGPRCIEQARNDAPLTPLLRT